MPQKPVKQEQFSDQEWLDRMYRKSESENTRVCAKTSLSVFECFCKTQGISKYVMIERYQRWFNQDKPDVRSICMSLDKLVNFMGKDHDEIMISENTSFKGKTPKTISIYLGFLKSYLRICHGIRLTNEDIQDYVQTPRHRKEPRKAVSLETLKTLFGKCDPTRRALYYVLVSSGMRLGEALSLKKSNFHMDENPVRITILADDTKTKEGRETYISAEALERVKPILETKRDDQYIFHEFDDVLYAVKNEDKYFMRLRERLGLVERYPNSIRFVINIHSLRAYFHTKASMKHGDDYANALDGHGRYLKQYYRLDDKIRAKMYLELEPELLIESVKIEADKNKELRINELENQLDEFQSKSEKQIAQIRQEYSERLKKITENPKEFMTDKLKIILENMISEKMNQALMQELDNKNLV